MMSYDDINEKLHNDSLDLINLIGVYSMIILSKEIFKKNTQAADFVKKTMNLNLANYIIKSRTLIIAKVIKTIVNYDLKEQKTMHIKCKEYFSTLNRSTDTHTTKTKTKKKKKSENEKLTTWLEGLRK